MAIIHLQGVEEQRRSVHYEVDAAQPPIGVGGMGQVFKGVCVDERTGSTRPVAIKFMYEDLPPQAVERARREASIQLRNDNLVEMLGFIETEEVDAQGQVRKHHHVVSELLEGVSLADILEGKTQDRDGEDVPFAVKMLQDYRNDSEHFAKTVVMSILSGLMALHDAGYIHRDIDPSNIMVTKAGNIKLIDFGIAKQMNALTTGDKALTVAGKFMGKPEYAAPELAMGDIDHQNQTTDIYAMGILLFQCIVGHTPFEGARHEILDKQMREKLPLQLIQNKHLRSVIDKACQKKQALRYQSTAQMRVAIEMEPATSRLNLAGLGLNLSNFSKKHIIVACAALAIVVVGVTIGLIVGSDNSNKSEAQPMAIAQPVIQTNEKDEVANVDVEQDTIERENIVPNNNISLDEDDEPKLIDESMPKITSNPSNPNIEQPKVNEPKATLSISPTRLTFKRECKAKGTDVINIRCSSNNWTVTGSPHWCTAKREGNTLKVTVQENNTGKDRTGYIVVACGTVSRSVTVMQNGNNELGGINTGGIKKIFGGKKKKK